MLAAHMSTLGGGYGYHRRGWAGGASPAAIVLLVLLVLWLAGRL